MRTVSALLAVWIASAALASAQSVSAALGSGAPEIRIPLSPFPRGAVAEGVTVDGDAIVLATGEEGGFVAVGTLELPLPFIAGKVVALEATSASLLSRGDFEGLGSDDILLYDPNDPEARTPERVGPWYSSASAPAKKPTIVRSADGAAVSLDRRASIAQFFRVSPGESYRLAFDLDPTALLPAAPEVAPQAFTVTLAFFDADFNILTFRSFDTGNASTRFQIHQSDSSDGVHRVQMRIRAIDGDSHVMYEDDAGVHEGRVEFRFPEAPDGSPNPRVNYDGGIVADSWGNEEIVYAHVEFKAQWLTGGSEYNDYHAIEAMDYLGGDRDHGFEELRQHTLSVKGLSSASGATLVYLDGRRPRKLKVKSRDEGFLIPRVTFGEMPVMVVIDP